MADLTKGYGWCALLALCWLAAPGGNCYDTGPPLSVCTSMKPGMANGDFGLWGHSSLAQNAMPGPVRPVPFYIVIYNVTDNVTGKHYYSPGQTITVSVLANQTEEVMRYKGIMLQARQLQCKSNQTVLVHDASVGKFSLNTDSLLKTMNCHGIDQSAVSHRSRQYKINETIEWTAPDETAGHVVFWATVVQDATVFWTGISSPVLYDPELAEPAKCGATVAQLSLLLPLAAVIVNLVLKTRMST